MTHDNAGKLVLRLTIGVLLLLHGLHKLMYGMGGVSSLVASQGWPHFIAYGVYIGEVLAPVLLILGLYTRAAAFIVVCHMLVAIFLAHMGQLFQLGNNGGWRLELQGLFLFGAFAISLLGAGRYSVGGAGGRYN
ncbi:DoxX family protein [Paracandidimonas soli]|uniref:Putative oxidoreductase n=1 Tax=Paracandidimonas soli TaxID=1917182 RepID=A0A4R3VDL0_9BURK|nr:DoxX family protein [Paracandidimonas soli]TCV01754.1 putative oxidoreductase [Paracandidimonas soli]